MKTKFTPGPWKVTGPCHYDVSAGDIKLATTYGHPKQAQDNARLIAKAPEIYDELKQAIEIIREIQRNFKSVEFSESGLADIDRAEKLIAEIDGES